MTTLRVGSLCSGYGGLDLAIREVLDAETVWVSDVCKVGPDGTAGHHEPCRSPCTILAHRFSHAPNLGDLTRIDWAAVTPVEILCAGFPCQDVSGAGRRAGLRHGTRTGLWHHIARGIGILRPQLVLLENVRGLMTARGDEPTAEHLRAECTRDAATRLIAHYDREHARAVRAGRTSHARALAARRGRAMGCHRRAVARTRAHERRLVRAVGTVLGSLADLGYDAVWYGVRASDIGAPHGRWRVFILAWPADAEGHAWRVEHGIGGAAADPGGEHRHERRLAGPAEAEGGGPLGEPAGRGRAPLSLLPTPDATHGRKTTRTSTLLPGAVEALLPTPVVNDMGEGKSVEEWDTWTAKLKRDHGNGNGHGPSLAVEAQRLLPTPRATHWAKTSDRARAEFGSGDSLPDIVDGDKWGKYAPAVARWGVLTRPAPPPTEVGPKGGARLSPRFSEWLMGPPDGWITEVPGITRNEALKACGNGVVPQQAAHALRVMLPLVDAALGVAA